MLKKILRKIGHLLLSFSESPRLTNKGISYSEETFRRWFSDDGDKTLRLDYDLNETSLVFDLGGYEGQWTSDIFSKYLCQIYVFEPYGPFVQKMEKRFSKNAKIKVYNFGLSEKTREDIISVSGDTTSLFRAGEHHEKISLMQAAEFMAKYQITNIDLMKINIEGAEYDLLDHLINSNLIELIDNIQIQFHRILPDAEKRMEDIQKRLSVTHNLTYQYTFVWENWKRKTDFS